MTIKDDDIKQQEKRVKDIREKIRLAMKDLEVMDHENDVLMDDELVENGNDEQENNKSVVKEEATDGETTTTAKTTTTTETIQVADGDVEMSKAEPKVVNNDEDVKKSALITATKEEPNGVVA